MPGDIIFEPLTFRNLTVKNRIFRSNISGRFDNYDGSGNQARINWEVEVRQGRRRRHHLVVRAGAPARPHRAQLRDDRQRSRAFRSGGRSASAVHEHDCKFILQLSHAGRQRDINGIEYPKGLSSTDKADPIARLPLRADDLAQIKEVVAAPSPRARAARARPGSTASSCTAPTAT